MALFKRPQSETPSEDESGPSQRPRKRAATVYDAVVGRISQWGFINSANPASAIQPLRPDEILYRARNAPTRYEEEDRYFAHKDLPPDKKLPSSDLLRALHGYISEFYGRSEERVSQKVWKSMDETALIALGILMEETVKEVLGDTGDLALVEGLRDGDLENDMKYPANCAGDDEKGAELEEEQEDVQGDNSGLTFTLNTSDTE